MKKILTIVGARPQFIKAAAISRAIANSFSDVMEEVILHTGQHYDENMSQVFFDELKIPRPKYNLESGSGEREEQINMMTDGISEICEKEQPDLILVYGDTNSTLAGAKAGQKINIPIAHVEAGLRSFNKEMPEEHNRIETDQLSTLLFSPTEEGISNLKNENVSSEVILSGDIMLDNSLHFAKLAEEKTSIISDLKLDGQDFVLATCHRPSNTESKENINSIFKALLQLSENYALNIVFPLHPRTRISFEKNVEEPIKTAIERSSRFYLIEPVSFLDMILLESKSRMIVTDSGGVQKEAFFFNKPCVVLRNETEWVELVENGNAILVGPNQERIIQAFVEFNKRKLNFPYYYGKGNAANIICQTMKTFLSR